MVGRREGTLGGGSVSLNRHSEPETREYKASGEEHERIKEKKKEENQKKTRIEKTN
jgi:hypothetical protein